MEEKRQPGRPRKTQEQVDTTQESIGKEGQTTIKGEGPASQARHQANSDIVDVITGPDAMNKLEKHAFYEEMLDVMVMETTDKNAVFFPQVAVNGRNQFFVRGQVQKVRRKFVDVLAGAKKTTYQQNNSIDPRTGNVKQEMIPMKALEYPFTVVYDPNPAGPEWLRSRLADGR